jgi:hypothetical protein
MLPRAVQRTVLIFGAILAALLFFLGGAALRLLMGPISLGPFASVIEDALNHSVSGVVIRFDQAVLEWSREEGKVNLIVLGTKVFDLDGHIIAQAPKADLDFDAAAIVSGHLNLKRFGLIGVQLTGVRTMEGAFRLGFGRDQSDAKKRRPRRSACGWRRAGQFFDPQCASGVSRRTHRPFHHFSGHQFHFAEFPQGT